MNIYEGKLVSQNTKVGIVAARFNEFITSKPVSYTHLGGRQFVYRDVLDHGDLHHPRHGRSDHRKLCHYGDNLRANPDADEYAGTLRAHCLLYTRCV